MTRTFLLSPIPLAVCLVALALSGCADMVHHRQGMNALERGDYVHGMQELKTAAELSPRNTEYRKDWLRQRELVTQRLLVKAESLVAQGKSADAEQAYQAILRYDPYNARALAGLENLKDWTQAAADSKMAADALKHGDVEQATQLVNRALERVPNLPAARALQRTIAAQQSTALQTTPSLSALYKKPINLEFRDASVKMVFDALARTTGINFIFDRDVRSDQRTTVFLKQTTLEDAIDVILGTNQLQKKILNPTSILIYPNTPAKLKEYQDLLVKTYYLSNISAKQAAEMLRSVLKLKDLYVNEQAHSIVLRESPETIALADKLIAQQDLEEPEVMLEVEVLEINRTRLLNLGIDWTNQFTITPLPGLATANGADAGTSTGDTTSGNGATIPLDALRNINRSQLGITLPSATINLQKLDGDADLLANPRLRVRDRQKAKILIGDKIPVVTTTTTPNGFASESVQYLDVGLKLEVEPEIHLHDEIDLNLGLEVSSLAGTIKTASGSQAYQIGTRNFNSSLHLKDGETQVLAGLISDADRSSANRIPLLGDMPLVGRLFGSQRDDRQKTEIVLSITPHLIRNIQRRHVDEETFWSGTEDQLRTQPLQLRRFDAAPSPSSSAARNATPTALPAAAVPAAGTATSVSGTVVPAAATDATMPNTSGVQLQWHGPSEGKVGQVMTLTLDLDSVSPLRAAPVQLAFNPALFDVVAVKEGDFFSKAGKSNFSEAIDKASGRVSVALAGTDDHGVKGQGHLFSVELRPLDAVTEGEISVISMTPIGTVHAVGKPMLPVTHTITVAP